MASVQDSEERPPSPKPLFGWRGQTEPRSFFFFFSSHNCPEVLDILHSPSLVQAIWKAAPITASHSLSSWNVSCEPMITQGWMFLSIPCGRFMFLSTIKWLIHSYGYIYSDWDEYAYWQAILANLLCSIILTMNRRLSSTRFSGDFISWNFWTGHVYIYNFFFFF